MKQSKKIKIKEKRTTKNEKDEKNESKVKNKMILNPEHVFYDFLFCIKIKFIFFTLQIK